MRRVLAAGAVVVPFVLGTAASSALDKDVVLTFSDPDIIESSGLVVTDDAVVTVNDSGDSARFFVVDPETGETVGTVSYDGEGRDVEALAPAGEGQVWVGDIGDNFAARETVEVHRAPIVRGDSTVSSHTYRLAYPDGPRDAEALLAHPRTGRLFIASKAVFGGGFYAAPTELDASGVNTLELIGEDVPGLVTDGAFFPDGNHLILRNYTTAFVLAFPSLKEVGSFSLPSQQQGEGIAVSPAGVVFLSSEGVESELLRVRVPAEIREAMEPSESTSTQSSPRPSTQGDQGAGRPSSPENDAQAEPRPDPWPWVIGGLVGVVAVVVLVRSLRPR